jgi:hypothetical protein
MGRPGPAAPENDLVTHVAMAPRHAHGAVIAAAAGAVARAVPAHHLARCGSVCGMSTTRVEATRWAT